MRIGAGVRWLTIAKRFPLSKYSYVHGQCKGGGHKWHELTVLISYIVMADVGVSGFLLRGGIHLPGGSSRLGRGAPNVYQYKMVVPDGRILVVSQDGINEIDEAGNVVSINQFESSAFSDKSLFRSKKCLWTPTMTFSLPSSGPAAVTVSSPSLSTTSLREHSPVPLWHRVSSRMKEIWTSWTTSGLPLDKNVLKTQINIMFIM